MNVQRNSIISCILLAVGVVVGAFGSHALEGVLDADGRRIWQTASNYHFIHALGSLLLIALDPKGTSHWMHKAVIAQYIGIIIFCGSLYTLAATGISSLGMVAPIGGTAFILSWIFAALGCKQIFGNG